MAYATCYLCGDYKNCVNTAVVIGGKKGKYPICPECENDLLNTDLLEDPEEY